MQSGANGNSPAMGASDIRFPGEDRGRSLAEMAQRDLDAALQLLADRAQFITGASGAAIALRRDGRNDMLCRASTGENAPELGALLSTEFGLSGESVRTRKALRCDDAERDSRVNREVCRQLGISSVVVMPVVHDDEVLGVFELFSGKANAFGDRDLSAVKRLSEMVETAVRMANATASLPEKLKEMRVSAPEPAQESEQVLDVDMEESAASPAPEASPVVSAPAATPDPAKPALEAAPAPIVNAAPVVASIAEPKAAPEVIAPKKKLFWSAALDGPSDAAKPVGEDQTPVPPVMRQLKKCQACGFPVSAERTLCVECEEKKWKGQLRR